MQIIIPMSGRGQRFIDAGYQDPKPLIKIDGQPIIEHVVNLFPGENNFTFICSEDHLQNTDMRSTLERIAPKGRINSIKPHKKGPVFAVSQILNLIDDDSEVIVNYCDFSMFWDYQDFLKHTRDRNADGAIPSYKNFHPHMLGTTNYAFQRDEKQWMLKIQEKMPFTDNRMNEYASVGTYYFKRGSIVKEFFPLLMEKDINLNGEFYVSLIYNLMVEAGLKISIFDVQHMLQWGTPQDVEEYNNWSSYFKDILTWKGNTIDQHATMNLIPMAGRGQRFRDEGYQTPKPLIPVSGKKMIQQAAYSLASADEYRFVCLQDHLKENPSLKSELQTFPNSNIVELEGVTEGQASTCMEAIRTEDLQKALLIGACDNGMLWKKSSYQKSIEEGADVIAWSFRNHPSSTQNPQMYGWLKLKPNSIDRVEGVSVKKAISDKPENDHAIVGTFYFKSAALFKEAYELLLHDDIRVNREFYVDSCIGVLAEKGYDVRVFEVDHYVCWGTPNDLKTFEYWQSFFHKCDWHEYSLFKDPTVANASRLEENYTSFSQPHR